MNKDFTQIPAEACKMHFGEVEFVDNGEGSKTAKIRLKARSGDAINHWYWGKIAHDLSGMRHKNRIPVDYAHNDGEVLGYVNHFDVASGDLVAAGALTPWRDDDRASEVIYKMRHGVPYEASIFFGDDSMAVEEVQDGVTAQVNGREFVGPGVIIRQWSLRGIAICPYGADSQTESVALSGGKTFSASVIAAIEGQEMDKEIKTDEAQPTELAAAVEPVETVETPTETATELNGGTSAEPVQDKAKEPEQADVRVEFKRMADEFGVEIASQVFMAGGSYEDALKLAYETAKTELAKAKSGTEPAAFAAQTEKQDAWKLALKKRS